MWFSFNVSQRVRIAIITITICIAAVNASAQSDRPGKPNQSAPQTPTQKPSSPGQPAEESIKIESDLVNIPVIASDRNDVYVYDLQKENFTVTEDGVIQEIVFFGAVREPFHVVLMLDTSGSTREKLGRIQEAAKAFVAQLQTQDRIKIISFDDNIRDWGEFTNDRAKLRSSIDFLSPGQGTKLYDAVKLALNQLSSLKGRKAIVLFTDGVDYRSDATKYDDNLRQVEESGVLVYPIRYDTRADTEALIREQQQQGETIDLGSILGGGTPTGSTPPTVPGGRSPVPNSGGIPDVMRLPIPPVVIGGGRFPDRYPRDRYPDDRSPRDRYPDDRFPRDRNPNDRFPRDRYPDDRFPDDRFPDDRSRRLPDPGRSDPRSRREDTTSVMLDSLYATADRYLADMSSKSGGRLYRADTLRSLPDAFANIAAELRNQYSLGYYPSNQKRDGQYRKVQVKVSRRDVVVRARPGYRAKPAN
jgi:Mg-chelatase subunit ChlD